MTVAELLEQAKLLSAVERKELAKQLIDMIEVSPITQPKTGAEIAEYLRNIPAIEFVDNDIDDPIEWVKKQRVKRHNYLDSIKSDEE